jgi:hypothetical protein
LNAAAWKVSGKNGQIEVVEYLCDGTRAYFEEGVRQSQATPDGENVLTYVKIMETLLGPASNFLVLGCVVGIW